MLKRVLALSLALAFVATLFAGCKPAAPPVPYGGVIKIGINAEITGDIPKVGEGTKYAAEMWLEDITKAGGLEVGGTKYKVELAIGDNESKAESAAAVATKHCVEDKVLVAVGAQASKQAIPAGEVYDANETPDIRSAPGLPTPGPPRTGLGSSALASSTPSRGQWLPSSPPKSSASRKQRCSTTWPATIPRA